MLGAYNPNFKQERQVQANPLDALRQMGTATTGMLDVFKNRENRFNARDAAKAKIIAETTADQRLSERDKIAHMRKLGIKDTDFQHEMFKKTYETEADAKAAALLNMNKMAAAKIDNSNKTAAEKRKAHALLAAQNTQRQFDMQKSDEDEKKDIKMAKLKASLIPGQTGMKEAVIQDIKTEGGLSGMVDNAEAKTTYDNWIFELDLDDDSKRRLESEIFSSIQNNPEAADYFRTNPKEYAQILMDSGGQMNAPGTTEGFFNNLLDSPYLPWGEDKWTPDTNEVQKKTID